MCLSLSAFSIGDRAMLSMNSEWSACVFLEEELAFGAASAQL